MKKRILVVDDNEINRQILSNLLFNDYEIIEAQNGKEAIDLLLENPKSFSAVLLDIVMPVLDGYQVLQRIEENALLSQIPVIVVTGNEEEKDRIKALELGANDFITKPFSPEIIKHCLRNSIAQREAVFKINALQQDKLTGLLNREAFFDKAETMLKEKPAGYYIMACFDVNHFKLINDQYGATFGDKILQFIGKKVQSDMKSVHGIGSRISGDNFAALYPNVEEIPTPIGGIQTLEEIPQVLKSSTAFSIGRYVVTDQSLSPSAIYDRAYLAKQSIKGRYDVNLAYFDEEMREKLLSEVKVISEMDQALKENHFEIWFQPQYNHTTGALIGAEALVRWRHPKDGLISPAKFIPVFEQNGFIYELDKFVWNEACKYLRKWMDEGRNPLPISVNISRYDLFKPDLIETITSLVKKYHLSPDNLRLEITESAFAKSTAHIVQIVKILIEHGFTIEIDDFGSGYSSLNTLKNVPAQVLKLDMRFLESDGIDSLKGGNILESVVRMTKWLGMSVIAEGVETKEQADFLKTIGCNYVQGYLYARPMPAKDYEALTKDIKKEDFLLSLENVELIGNNALWDPRSMDTLIFNSYVGAACIFEYCNSRIETLRANEKYAKLLGGDQMSLNQALRIDWPHQILPTFTNPILEAIQHAVATGKEASCEGHFSEFVPGQGTKYLQAFLKIIAKAEDRYLFFCSLFDITDKKKDEEVLKSTDEQLVFLNETAHNLLSQQDCDKGIEQSLEKLLDYFDGNRAYIFEFDLEKLEANNTYEVCAKGSTPEKENLQHISMQIMNFWIQAFKKQNFVEILDVDSLDESRTEEKQTLLAQGIKSLIAVPLYRDGKLIGFMGIDDPSFHSNISRLAALGDYVAVMLTRRDLTKKILGDNEILTTLMNDTPGGFCRMHVLPDGRTYPVYVNAGLCRLFGMTHEEVMKLYSSTAYAGVHPDDIELVLKAEMLVLQNGEAHSPKFRLLHGNGGYVWLSFFGKKTTDQAGNVYLNVYYSEPEKMEQQRHELLENLPCGVGICEITDSGTRVTYLNKRFFAFFRNFPGEFPLVSFLALIHPDDKENFFQTLKTAVSDGGEKTCITRIKDGNQNFITFRITGVSFENSREEKSVYITFTPITNEELSFNEMLPVALRVMMSSQTDFAFVKDTSLRYVCGSTAAAEYFGLSDINQIPGKTDFDFLGREEAEIYAAEETTLLRTGKPIIDALDTLTKKNGSVAYISTSKFPLYNSKGNVIGLYGISRDITEEKRIDTQMKLLTDSILVGIASYEVSNEKYRVTYFNDGFCKLFELTREEYSAICSKNVFAGIFEKDLPHLKKQLAKQFAGENNADCIFRICLKNETIKWVNFKSTVTERTKEKIMFNSVFFDVTPLQETLEKLRVQEDETRLAVELSGIVIANFNVAQRTLTLPQKTAKAHGLSPIQRNMPFNPISLGIISEETKETYASMYKNIINGQPSGTAVYCIKILERWRWREAKYSTIFSDSGKPVSAVISFTDITDKLETIEQAQKDPLTGVLNRTTFSLRLDQIIQNSDRQAWHALMLLDLDGFKKVNDLFGHETGDTTLIQISQLFQKQIGSQNLLGRLGGDEFIIFLPNIGSKAAIEELAKGICSNCRIEINQILKISISIGISIAPKDGTEFKSLYSKADKALYQVKETGKDNFSFFQDKP